MTDSLSRYYDSIGRGKDAPFFDPKLNYAETEPDLTEPVNKAIDEQIKDTQAFFKAEIENYNASLKVRDQAFKDLASLTKDGIKMVKRYKKHKDDVNFMNFIVEKGNDKEYMTKWTTGDIDFQKQASILDKDINVLIGEATDSINKTGSYTFEAEGGKTVTFQKKDLEEFELALQQSKGLTGSNASKQANILWPSFVEISKSHMLHSGTGLRFDELTSEEDKLEWYYEMAAQFIGFVKSSNDRISDADIIKNILPTIKTDMKTQIGSGNVVTENATKKTLSEEVLYGGGTQLMGLLSNSKHGTLNFDSVFDTKAGMIKNKTAFYQAQNYSPNDALEASLKDFEKIVEFAYRNLGMTRDDYYRLVNEHKLKHTDGRTDVVYADMGPLWAASVKRMDLMLSEIDKERDKLTYESRFQGFKDRYEEKGTVMSAEEANEFIGSDIYAEVIQFRNNTISNTLTGGKDDKYSLEVINLAAQNHVKKEELGQGNVLQTNRYTSYIQLLANEDYFRIKNTLEKGNVDPAQARADALTKVTENIQNGVYDDGLPNPEADFDPGKVYEKNAAILDGASKETLEAWLNEPTAHLGEGKYLSQGNYQVDFGGEAPALYKNLARFFPDLDWRGVMIRRLRATKNAGPNEYEEFLSPLRGKVDSFSARNLTHHPTDASVNFVLLNEGKNLQELEKILLNRDISRNMEANAGGVDGIYYASKPGVEGSYENMDWSNTNIVTLMEGMAGDKNKKDKFYGMYGIRGDNLWKLLSYMVDNNMPLNDRVFDKEFQRELMLLNIALESQEKLTLNGDVSWLGMLPISATENKTYKEIFLGIKPDMIDKGEEGIWNEVRYLLKSIGRYKIEKEILEGKETE